MVVPALAIRSLMPTKNLRNSYEQCLDLSLSSSVALHFILASPTFYSFSLA
jgi:hypothetical protein